jgi:tripartite-type tricarboxylate transporter receptor subunit TctC
VVENVSGAGGMIAAAQSRPCRTRRPHHPAAPGRLGGGHVALSGAHI